MHAHTPTHASDSTFVSLRFVMCFLFKMEKDCARVYIQRKFLHQIEVFSSSRQVYQLLLCNRNRNRRLCRKNETGRERKMKRKLIKITSTVIANYMSSNMVILSIRSNWTHFRRKVFFFYFFSDIRCEQVFPFNHDHDSSHCVVAHLIDDTFAYLVFTRGYHSDVIFSSHFILNQFFPCKLIISMRLHFYWAVDDRRGNTFFPF